MSARDLGGTPAVRGRAGIPHALPRERSPPPSAPRRAGAVCTRAVAGPPLPSAPPHVTPSPAAPQEPP
ncbi:hypothetical protein LWC35_13040 [Pseudonocardia kujensis]|uniref:hypothetical protein n=1 Tax=Pseudonocardia kujensis TaxID=1128675 RepID=UPI001E4DC8F5|nr:hypothetical protein [Pseudonocardia kujensis]MCE0763827.1 hypothetical protein [Pseudonocardia kujensis]